jgi:hypothetical protein
VEDWKAKSNKMQMELNHVKAQYKSMEIKVSLLRISFHATFKRTISRDYYRPKGEGCADTET